MPYANNRTRLGFCIKSMLLAGIASALLVVPAVAADRAHTVITANTGQVNTIDPIRSDYAQTYDVVARLYSPLVTYDVEYNVIGDLASDYKVADDAKSIDFTLRDASFHSGNKVTAADVAYSFDRTKRLGIGTASFLALYDSAEVKDDTHLTIRLTQPSALFLGGLTKIFILDSKLVTENAGADDGQAWLAANDAGSGPYKLASFDANNVVLEWFDKYWVPMEDRAPAIAMRRIDESATRRDEMLAGNVDIANSITDRDFLALRDQPGLGVSNGAKTTIDGIYFNTRTGPTADVRVRQAISLAYDYQGALKAIHQNRGEIGNGPLPSALACRPDLPVAAQDTEKARQLLADAGQSNLVLTLSYQPVFQDQVQMATLLQSNLKDIGVTLNLEPIAFPNYLERLKTPDQIPQMMLIADYSQFPDPGDFLAKIYMTDSIGTNRSGYSNPEFDAMMAAALVNPNAAERCEVYKQAQTLLEEQKVFMAMFQPDSQMIYRAQTMKDPQLDVPDPHYVPLTYRLQTP